MCNCGTIAITPIKTPNPIRVIRPVSAKNIKNAAKNEVNKHRI
jgi:hypothetical protein